MYCYPAEDLVLVLYCYVTYHYKISDITYYMKGNLMFSYSIFVLII